MRSINTVLNSKPPRGGTGQCGLYSKVKVDATRLNVLTSKINSDFLPLRLDATLNYFVSSTFNVNRIYFQLSELFCFQSEKTLS